MLCLSQLLQSEVLDNFDTLWVYKPIMHTQSDKMFILAKTSL